MVLFLLCVVSFDPHAVSGLLPWLFFPVVLVTRAGIPARWVLRRLWVLAPFPLLVGLFNPLLDTQPMLLLDGLTIGGGWFSWLSILLRFLLAMSVLLVLVATTSLPELGRAAERLGTPRIFVTQILLMYRYLFVLTDEAERMARARDLRSFGGHGRGWSIYARLVGHLLLRAVGRAERIHQAMLCRGFKGTFPTTRASRLQAGDWTFLVGWSLVFVAVRFLNPVERLGAWIIGSGA
ncbi:MAG: cobalt ECF transporter T component CbiQ [Magnetococcales bacterium]|nr:cobalt ECF transporter T component CbiQ [Magnetococcales bacterium]